jgi:hypothetical protein
VEDPAVEVVKAEQVSFWSPAQPLLASCRRHPRCPRITIRCTACTEPRIRRGSIVGRVTLPHDVNLGHFAAGILRFIRTVPARAEGIEACGVDKCPLWVAKQHGHTVTTMLKAYAAWAEGATQSDIRAIQRAMTSEARTPERTDSADRVRPESSPAVGGSVAQRGGATTEPRVAIAPSPSFATGLATRHRWGRAKCSKRRELTGGERGTRTLDPGIMTDIPALPGFSAAEQGPQRPAMIGRETLQMHP